MCCNSAYVVLIQLTSLLDSASGMFSSCSSALLYEGQVCQRELSTERVTCLSEDTLNVTVADQDNLEQFVTLLFSELHNFDPSPRCYTEFRSFTCLLVFGVCSTNSTMLATRQMCFNVRDEVCVREWREISDFLGPGGLPVCEELPEGPAVLSTCPGML